MGRDASSAKILVTTNSRGVHVPDLSEREKSKENVELFFYLVVPFSGLAAKCRDMRVSPPHENKVWCNGTVLSAFLEDTSSDIPAAYTSRTDTYTYSYGIASNPIIPFNPNHLLAHEMPICQSLFGV